VVTIRLVMLSGLASVARLIARDFLANGTPIGHQACDTGGKGRVIAAVDNGLEPDAFQIESATCSQSLVSTHDLIVKIVPIFADHALDAVAKFKSHGCEQHLYITSALPWLIFTASAPHSAASAAE
jgi:hypothetical protein